MTPPTRCAAAGEKTSRPWKVAETGSSTYASFVISCAASIPPSFSAAGTSSPLSGPTKSRPSPGSQRQGEAPAADPRVNHGQVHALREVRERVREHDRALQHAVPLDPVGDVEDLDLGRDHLHHAVAGADEIVLEAEVAQEGDQHVSATLTNPRPRRGRPDRAYRPRRRPGDRATRRRESSGARSRRPGCRRRAPRTTSQPTPTQPRRDRPRAARPAEPAGCVERDEVGAELVDRASARSLGRREQHPAGAGTPRGGRPARDSRDESGLEPELAKRLGRPRAHRCDPRERPGGPPDELRGAVRARHDHPVVALDVDRIVGRLDLDQRALDNLVTLLLRRCDEWPRLLARTRDDDLHAAKASSSDASAAGSSPAAALDPTAVRICDERRQRLTVVMRRDRSETNPADRRHARALEVDPARASRVARRRPRNGSSPRRT